MRNTTDTMLSIDFWNTLVDPETGSESRYQSRLNAIREVAGNYGKKAVSAEQIETVFETVSDHFQTIWLNEHRTPRPDELTKRLLNELGIEGKKKDIRYLSRKIQHSLLAGPPALAPNAKEVITELAQAYKLVIISDTMYTPGRVLRSYLAQQELSTFFSGYIFSDEMGFSKPDVRAFEKALLIAKAKPHTSFHIGDLEHTDIAGAKASGMSAILYTGLGTDEPETTQADHVFSDWLQTGNLLL